MRKLIITGAALVALAVPAVASASVNVDDAGNGFVGKGDVQTALGLANDAAMQALYKANGVHFTIGTERSLSTETVWKCGISATNWTQNSRTSTVHYAAASANATANTNNAGKLTNGWNIAGSAGGAFVGGEYTGAAFVGQCPAGKAFRGFLPHVFSETGSTAGLYVNGVALPNTPAPVL